MRQKCVRGGGYIGEWVRKTKQKKILQRKWMELNEATMFVGWDDKKNWMKVQIKYGGGGGWLTKNKGGDNAREGKEDKLIGSCEAAKYIPGGTKMKQRECSIMHSSSIGKCWGGGC